jgi:hypothetical protein
MLPQAGLGYLQVGFMLQTVSGRVLPGNSGAAGTDAVDGGKDRMSDRALEGG